MKGMLKVKTIRNKISGIYKIENITNSKKYIGQSKDLEKRIKDHKNSLNKNKHYNVHLQNSHNKYGRGNFTYEIIETCDLDIIDERETFWIDYYHSRDSKYGYNVEKGGNTRKKLSAETKLNMRRIRVAKRRKLSVICISCIYSCKQDEDVWFVCDGYEEDIYENYPKIIKDE